jgi:hypothetical protein
MRRQGIICDLAHSMMAPHVNAAFSWAPTSFPSKTESWVTVTPIVTVNLEVSECPVALQSEAVEHAPDGR